MIEWRKVAGQMRADLDRAALNENPRLVLAVLIKATLMKGRTVVILPDREVLCGLLGIAKQHMKGVWKQVEDAGIAKFRKLDFGWECVLNPDASQWACEWVCTREQVDQWIAWLERVPGQAQGSLLPPEPNLRQAVADVGAEAVSNKKCYSPPPPAGPPVTKFVTPPVAVPAFAVPSSTRIEKEMNPSRVLESSRGLWGDGYIAEKLERRRLLREELQAGETII